MFINPKFLVALPVAETPHILELVNFLATFCLPWIQQVLRFLRTIADCSSGRHQYLIGWSVIEFVVNKFELDESWPWHICFSENNDGKNKNQQKTDSSNKSSQLMSFSPMPFIPFYTMESLNTESASEPVRKVCNSF